MTLIVLTIAFVARFYKLGEIPNGLYQDETAIGYNAYSILTNGRDEHNISYPLYFKSFGDQKLPIYIYLTSASVQLFGLNAFAVRFPSALFGFLSILLFFFYLRAISKNEPLALVATALLAINPWHVFYSRASFEVSIALFFFLAGALLLYKRRLFVSTLCFLVAFYSYNLTRLLAPVLFLLLLSISRKEIRTVSKMEVLATAVATLVGLIPFIAQANSGGGATSAAGTLITSSAVVQAPLIEFRSYMTALPLLITKIFFNSWVLTFWQYVVNIASYFSVPFFFLTGSSHGNHGVGTSGQFYLLELPLLLLGIFAVLKEKLYWTPHLVIWAAATIGIAALTREAPHATRSFFLVIPVVTIIAWGFLTLASGGRRIITLIFCAFFLWNVAYYFSSYFIRFPIAYAKSWRSADRDLSLFIKDEGPKYEKILFDNSAGFTYSSLLFYTSYPPNNFQSTARWAKDDSEGFSQLLSFGKYEFKNVDWSTDYGPGKKTLIITTPDRKPEKATPLKAFYYPKRPVVLALKQQIINYPTNEVAYIAVATP